ncbi:MAG: Rdx family protein [Candidatus Obscuribacterales bacterium]|jgi:selT/selW/selH-like putative selenoprotein
MADTADKRFKITYCTSLMDYKDRAVKLSEQLEKDSSDTCLLVPADSGVFEVEDQGVLIFSKKTSDRFPEEGEVQSIIKQIKDGHPLEEAQTNAAHEAGHSGGVLDWIYSLFRAPSHK